MDSRLNSFVAEQQIQARMGEATSARTVRELARMQRHVPSRRSVLAWLTGGAPETVALPRS